MIRKKEENPETRIVVDLTGPEGNAFWLIALAEKLGRQLEVDPKRRGEINAEMMGGDYDNLLEVLEREYGDYIVLEM
jgi:hypothetical protein